MYWKRWEPNRSKGRLGLLSGFVLLFCCISGLLVTPAAADKISDLQVRFDKEKSAPSKEKILEKLGQAQFVAINAALDDKDFIKAGLILEKYRDNARVALDSLEKQIPNADKHAEPYRHLELVVRGGIRQVEEILLVVPFEVKPPIELVRQDLITIDDELIHLLFPKRMMGPPPRENKP